MSAASSVIQPSRYEDSPELLVAGVNRTYTMENRGGIPQQWDEFAPRLGTIPGQVGRNAYGVCWNFTPDFGFDYLTGIEIYGNELPPDFTTVSLPAGRYAVFTHDGPISTFPKTISAIWSDWAPTVTDIAHGSPCFERYTAEFDPATGRGTEVWVPLISPA
ncbi:GyrI-like domain-containing protein [Planctomicrobium piriforme]|uniref:AraC family transcriptional regulator n=1 Tax=Planctomicrobium piriforme TaxID=1576369 RepID=A0A1I3GKU1_9PLAN|nr:GyrI-like domain-containing protein [Planctomicrobium piriforme]SFI24074.1 AraC family transcriptional regulator [Planctomicrobium piriforme]